MKFCLEFTVPVYSSFDGEHDDNGAIMITIAEIHRKIEQYGTGGTPRTIRDLNGNTIGSWDLTPDA